MRIKPKCRENKHLALEVVKHLLSPCVKFVNPGVCSSGRVEGQGVETVNKCGLFRCEFGEGVVEIEKLI